MKVINKEGTADNKCTCGSWIKHWEKFNTIETDYCAVKGCIKKDRDGAHVRIADGEDESWYITPLCSDHHKPNLEVDIVAKSYLVSANKSLTCDKKSTGKSKLLYKK